MDSDVPDILPSRGLVIRDPWGTDIVFEDDLPTDWFVQRLIDRSVPYIECHRKCAAQSLCPHVADEADEVKCPIQARAIQNFFKYSGTEANLTDQGTLLAFSQAAIMYGNHVFSSFYFSGGALDEDFYRFWKGALLRYPFWGANQTRRSASDLMSSLRKIVPDTYAERVLVVEGESEEIIFTKLFAQGSQGHWIPGYEQVRNLHGEGNLTRVELLLKELRRQHFEIHILGDGDGQLAGTLKRLVRKSLLSPDEYTLFDKALEDAFPRALVVEVFKTVMGSNLAGVVEAAAESAWKDRKRTFSRELKKSLRASALPDKEVGCLVSKAKVEASKLFANELDDQLHRSPDLAKSKHEILCIVHRLMFARAGAQG